MTLASQTVTAIETTDVRSADAIKTFGGVESERQQPRTVVFPDGSEIACRPFNGEPRWIEVRL